MTAKFSRNYTGSRKWIVKRHDEEAIKQISSKFNVSPVTALFLLSRNITDEKKINFYKTVHYTKNISPLKDTSLVEKTVTRIIEALKKGEKIIVYGDYDVDGITSITIFIKALNALSQILNNSKGGIIPLLPHRIKDGYGITPRLLEEVRNNKATLLITFDCGIKDPHNTLEKIQNEGCDVIVVDHHISSSPPPVKFLFSPTPSSSPFADNLLSAGAASLRLVEQLFIKAREEYSLQNNKEKELHKLFNNLNILASFSVISDIVPLTGDNFLIAKRGIQRLNTLLKNNGTDLLIPGIKALIEVAGISSYHITEHEILFYLAPRINAASRIDTATRALQLFLTSDEQEARELARKLNDYNKERQELQKQAEQEALEQLSSIKPKDSRIIVLHGEKWHKGIIGIIASKIMEITYRPSIVICGEEGILSGSGRSIPSINIIEILDLLNKSDDSLLETYGGHKYACGLKIKKENINKFKEKINELIQEITSQDHFIPHIHADGCVSLSSINIQTAQELAEFGPYGPEHEKPIFYLPSLLIETTQENNEKGFLSFLVTDNNGNKIKLQVKDTENLAEKIKQCKTGMDALVHIEFRREQLQITLVDVKKAPEDPDVSLEYISA